MYQLQHFNQLKKKGFEPVGDYSTEKELRAALGTMDYQVMRLTPEQAKKMDLSPFIALQSPKDQRGTPEAQTGSAPPKNTAKQWITDFLKNRSTTQEQPAEQAAPATPATEEPDEDAVRDFIAEWLRASVGKYWQQLTAQMTQEKQFNDNELKKLEANPDYMPTISNGHLYTILRDLEKADGQFPDWLEAHTTPLGPLPQEAPAQKPAEAPTQKQAPVEPQKPIEQQLELGLEEKKRRYVVRN